LFVARNVIDLREPVHYQRPTTAEQAREIVSRGRLWGNHSGHEHNGPIWEPLFFYQNTCLLHDPPFHDIYGCGLAAHTNGTTRRLLNDVFVQEVGLPGKKMPPAEDDFVAAGNVFWSLEPNAAAKADRAHGLFADPRFLGFARGACDLRLAKESPAIGAGVALPPELFDPLRETSGAKPDAGAVPHGSEAWTVGIDGRIRLY
jgi:hypothetical protein